MTPQTLPLNEILIKDRQRLDYGDMEALCLSLSTHGIIQPVVITQEKRLIAGGRRCEAARRLGWTHIAVVYKESLSQDQLHILELEENIQRKEMSWQEKALNILTIHELKVKLKAQDSQTWGCRETGEMLSVSFGHVSYCLTIARFLREELQSSPTPIPEGRFWSCDSLSNAWRLYLRDKEDAALSILASKHKEANPTIFEEEQVFLEEFNSVSSDNLDEERSRYYSNPLNPPDSFDSYWAEKTARASAIQNTIYLSNRLIQGDSISYMLSNPGRFDHIITDIPYGIDMVMLNQQHPRGQIADLDTVEELHDVSYNLKLIEAFFPAAFVATKEKSFVITWADQMLWQFMHDCAIKAGFVVQRWPITWHKTSSCMNQCIAYNTTKNTEIAIVCRKPGATLAKQPQSSVVSCPRDTLCDSIGHPFAKPFEAWKFLLDMATLEGHTILEPFAGRGSGIISMLMLNRNPVGVELDTAHYNALLENVKTLFYLPLNPNSQFK